MPARNGSTRKWWSTAISFPVGSLPTSPRSIVRCSSASRRGVAALTRRPEPPGLEAAHGHDPQLQGAALESGGAHRHLEGYVAETNRLSGQLAEMLKDG